MSFLDVDGERRAGSGGFAGVVGSLRWRAVIEKDDDSVIVALVEYVAGVQNALP
jgi:hypothetical protein